VIGQKDGWGWVLGWKWREVDVGFLLEVEFWSGDRFVRVVGFCGSESGFIGLGRGIGEGLGDISGGFESIRHGFEGGNFFFRERRIIFDTLADFEGVFVKDVGAMFADGVVDEVLDFLVNDIATGDEFDEGLVEFVVLLGFDDFPDFIGDGL
jgi:hypothetical protein